MFNITMTMFILNVVIVVLNAAVVILNGIPQRLTTSRFKFPPDDLALSSLIAI